MKIFKNKERKQIFLSALLLVIIIVLYIELNVLIEKINIKKVDITEDGAYSISEESKNKISKIDKDVKIIVVGLEKENDKVFVNNLLNIVNEFDRLSEKITTEIWDDESNENNPYIIFECGSIVRKVWTNELYQYKFSSSYENEETLYLVEPAIENSILSVVNESNGKIYICMDKSVYSEEYYLSFVNVASVLGIDTYALNLAADMKVPDDCECLVIAPIINRAEDGTAILSDFSDEEKNVIVDYINNGGNILFLQESKSLIGVDTPNLDYIMSLYGVSISDGVIYQENNIIQDKLSYIHPDIEMNNDILKSLNKDSIISLFDAGILNINNDEGLDVKQKVILKSNDSSFIRKDINQNADYKVESDVDAKNSVLGVYVEKKIGDKSSKAIVYSNSVIATNTPIPTMDTVRNKGVSIEAILWDDNSELMADSIRALTNKSSAIYCAKNQFNQVPSINILTDNITLKIIFIIPMIIIFVGYIVWRYRKNKK